MDNLVNILIVSCMFLFSLDTFRCFSKVYKFNEQNGYRNETICYIKSPHHGFTKNGKIVFFISKWTVKVLIIFQWGLAIYLFVFQSMKFQGMLLVFASYMLVLLWFEVYSVIYGAKILESGIANGFDKINWEKIEEFQFINKTSKLLSKTYIKLKYNGHFIPKYIQITTENKELVKRLFKEKCVI